MRRKAIGGGHASQAKAVTDGNRIFHTTVPPKACYCDSGDLLLSNISHDQLLAPIHRAISER